MREAADDVELLNKHDAAFHRAVIAATGNQTLATVLEGISSRTLRARVWRGLVDDDAAGRTLAEHEAIYDALVAGDAVLRPGGGAHARQHDRDVAALGARRRRGLPGRGRRRSGPGRY